MKEFLKENIALAAAIVLPLVLVIVFVAATAFTSATVEPPKNDFLLASDYSNGDSDAVRFEVVQNKLVATYRYPRKENDSYMYGTMPRLWRVHADTMAVEEIALPLPADSKEKGKPAVELALPGITGAHIMNIQPGPDGYSFEFSDRYNHGNIMTELFSYDGNENGVALIKNGRVVQIKAPNSSIDRYNTQFIGWIVEEQDD